MKRLFENVLSSRHTQFTGAFVILEAHHFTSTAIANRWRAKGILWELECIKSSMNV